MMKSESVERAAAQPPLASHTCGSELVVGHIGKFRCPMIVPDDPAKLVPGTAGL